MKHHDLDFKHHDLASEFLQIEEFGDFPLVEFGEESGVNVYTLVKNHEKSIPCNQCTNTFLVACILTTHLRTHW